VKPDAAIVIVGAGHAGVRAAHTLRAEGWMGKLILLCAEPDMPYERPPLSKTVLLNEKSMEECRLFDLTWYRDNEIDLRLGATVSQIRRAEQTVVLDDGSSIQYHRLLLATGAAARRLLIPGATLPGVQYLRSGADALCLKERFGTPKRVVVIGGGFIGLEVAASAISRGCEVTVIELGQRLLQRGVPAPVATRLEAKHRDAGVDLRLGTGVDEIVGREQVEAVVLANGERVECDIVVVGVGAVPRVELAEAAGLDIENGIVVDETLRTSDPAIFAAGDAVSFPHRHFGRRIRLESWKNAEDQGAIVARNMLGKSETYSEVPWFWSDQYNLTIQVAGILALGTTVVQREVSADATLYFDLDADGVIVGASGVGTGTAVGRDIRIAQMLIARRACPAPERLADPTCKLKLLLQMEAA
jgi:3-phenylpropionate/trans-cinnamate dioxygenase ferredoxin reductase subunit